jgi:hypothetical protein
MAKGPLAVRWGAWTIDEPHAGTLTTAHVEIENSGNVPWRESVRLSYHWLDARDNPIVWDGYRASLPLVEPGERVVGHVAVRAPIPPGRYRFAPDLVVEHRAWFSELGSPFDSAEVEVLPRAGASSADLPAWVTPAADWRERVDAAHREGYAVVAGTIEWQGGFGHRRPHALASYAPGPGRVVGFPHPLLCPSVLEGVELHRLDDVAGLPAFAAPTDEPWLYDGRIVLHAGRRLRPGR